jgi:lysophospholipase L1-like esterase
MREMRICFIGDSYVNGTGDDACLGWAGRICSDARRHGCEITLYNLGIRGNTTADIAERWEREAKARLSPEQDGRLVFSFGVNDCLSEMPGCVRVPEAASIANARGILAKASAWLPTLMIGPPPIGDAELDERVKRFSAALNVLCDELSVPFLSTWECLIASDTWLREAAAGDGAHPNRAGYSVLADFIARWDGWRSWVDTRSRLSVEKSVVGFPGAEGP